jgi:predicted HTH transcriptional regulator
VTDDIVVRDSRIDEEKVSELRGIGGETESLDFKRTADLRELRAKLAITKDIVSLANNGGGFLVIGCDDRGELAVDMPPLIPDQWEPANLMGIVAKYVTAPISLNARTHLIDGRIVAILAVQPSMRSLPTPFAADGEWYDHNNKPRYEFRKGQIWIRNGPRNATLDFHD